MPKKTKTKKKTLRKICIRKTIALNVGVVFALGHFAKVEQIWRQGQKMAYFGAELESATTYEKQFRSWPNVQYY